MDGRGHASRELEIRDAVWCILSLDRGTAEIGHQFKNG